MREVDGCEMRKNLYIIGARGFGREVALELPTWNGFCDQYVIKGFLDDMDDALDGFSGYPPIVSSVEDFVPSGNDIVVCGLGTVMWRRKYIDMLLTKGARFDTFISPESRVARTAKIGQGVLVLENVSISADVKVGDFVLFHPNSTLGHDVEIGNYTVIENGVFCGGFVKVGERATIHTRATILPHQKIGDNAVVGACSCVIRNVKPSATVFGNPAQRIDQ